MHHSIDFETFNAMFKVSSKSKSNLIWACEKKNVFPGKPAGSIYQNGYWCVRLRPYENAPRVTYFVHRIVYVLYYKTSINNLIIDHIDQNKLNNAVDNLRIANLSQNQQNKRKYKANATSFYKGVAWSKSNCKWVAYINVNKKRMHIGYYLTEEEAALAYNKKAQELHGPFAFLNHV